MAVNAEIQTLSISIEVENGTDKNGATVYKKKNFSGIKSDAANEDILAVANAIKEIINKPTRDVLLNNISKLVEQA